MRSRATTIGIAGILIAGLTGCTFTAAQTVQEPYDPSDGIGETVGDLAIRNAILITEDGSTANLVVSLVNTGTRNIELSVSWEGGSGQVDRKVYLAAGTTRSYGEEYNRIILRGIDADLGASFPVYFQYGDVEGVEMGVPVLDGALAEYADLVPES